MKNTTKKKNQNGVRLTLLQANALIREADRLFRRSARAWERGNHEQEKTFAERGAKLLAPLGIICDWPGLYPCFKVGSCAYLSTEAAVSAALDQK